MTTLTLKLSLPDELARDAREAGLLTSEAIETMIRDRLRDQTGRELRSMWAAMPAEELSDERMAEIVTAVKAVRAEGRRNAR